MGAFLTSAEPRLAELAFRQHGVVSLAQLVALGFTKRKVERAVAKGWLHRVHRGVYAVGHARLTFHGWLWAAVLATGGVLSHRSAAALWDLVPTPSGPVHVTGRGRSITRVVVHHSRVLVETDVTEIDGLRVTTVARTIVDLAPGLTGQRVERLCARAEVLRLFDARAFADVLARRPCRKAAAALAVVAATGPQRTRSELEEDLLKLVVEERLPRPEVNAVVCGYEVDMLWREARLIVELDGAATHLTRTAFEADRERDAVLQLAGYTVLRVTDRQLRLRRAIVAARLRSSAGSSSAGRPAGRSPAPARRRARR